MENNINGANTPGLAAQILALLSANSPEVWAFLWTADLYNCSTNS